MSSITMDRSEVSGRRTISEEQDEEGSEWQCGSVAVWQCGSVAVWQCGKIRGGVWLATTATEEVEVLNCGQKKIPI